MENEPLKNLIARVPESRHKKLRIALVDAELTISDWCNKMIVEYLAETKWISRATHLLEILKEAEEEQFLTLGDDEKGELLALLSMVKK